MPEVEQLITEAIDRLAQKQAMQTAPQNRLCDTLALRSVTKLKELARAYRIKGYTKMDKPRLAAAVGQELLEPERLEELLYILEAPEWVAFQKTAATELLPCDGVVCAHLGLLQSRGYVQTYFYEDKLCAVLPLEIREVFSSIVNTGFCARKERGDRLHTYAAAVINLYGIISQDEFVALFNAQNFRRTDIDEVFQTLIKHVMVRSNYCFWDEYIVSDSFEDEDFEGAVDLLRQTEGKPRYIPPKKELLKFADDAYYEPTVQTNALAQHLKTLLPDADEAQTLADEICFECSKETSVSDILDILHENGVVMGTMQQAEQMVSLLMNVKNNSRIWANKGHTPKELFEQFREPNIIPFKTPVKSEKIGRNNPCPCGSGKKYKRCCGK